MIATEYTVLTPRGSFLAQWDDDSEVPVQYTGSAEGLEFFRLHLSLNLISGTGGRLINADSLEPDDLYGFCQDAASGIVVLPGVRDLRDIAQAEADRDHETREEVLGDD
ncbi:hypothetical protein BJP27_24065 (plasmid) [Pseudomonas oryzihabitans]|nr:hypothetical protein BJP27_24065 [Pseudomonas psychrotolerans]